MNKITLAVFVVLTACATVDKRSGNSDPLTAEELALLPPIPPADDLVPTKKKAVPKIRTYRNPTRQVLVTARGVTMEWAPGGPFCGLGQSGDYKCFMIGIVQSKNGMIYGVAKRQLLYYDWELDNFVLEDVSEKYEYRKSGSQYYAVGESGDVYHLDFSGGDPRLVSVPASTLPDSPLLKKVDEARKPPAAKDRPAKDKKKPSKKQQKNNEDDDDLPPRTRRVLARSM